MMPFFASFLQQSQPVQQQQPLEIDIEENQDMREYDVNLERLYYSYAETDENRDDFVHAFGPEELNNAEEYDIEAQRPMMRRPSTAGTEWSLDDEMPPSIPLQSSSQPIAAAYDTRLIDVPEDCDCEFVPPCYIIDVETGFAYTTSPPNRLVRCVFAEHNPSDYPELYERYRYLVGNQQPDAFWSGE